MEAAVVQPRAYPGMCSVCGGKALFERGSSRSIRESFACASCGAVLRYRDQAAVIVDEFGKGMATSLRQLARGGYLDGCVILESALRGPFVTAFSALPGYVQMYFWPDRPRGEFGRDRVRNEDLTQLTFESGTFDVVITSDVLEHVPDIRSAFREISRVLKPGGIHVFTIPNDWPFPPKTSRLVEIVDGAEHFLEPPVFHESGDGTPCLVYHRYGADLVELIAETGCRTQVIRRSSSVDPCYVNATFVSRRVG
jgi:SAM-dependent methyltransferase